MNASALKIQARRQHTEDRIMDAFEAVLCENGIRNLSMNAVAAEAGMSKTLIYRYFGDPSGLVRAWGERRAVFLDSDPPEGTGEDRFDNFKDLLESDLMRTAEHLRTHPMTLEFLAEELTGQNPYSDAFNEVRLRSRGASSRRMMRDSRYMEPDNRRLTVIVYAAIAHLAMRRRHSPSFFGIELDTDEGWQEIENFLHGIFEDARLAEKVRKGEI